MKNVLIGLLLALALVTVSAQDTPPPQIDAAVAELSAIVGENVTVPQLDAYAFEINTFGSTALGCPSPEAMYAQVVTDAYIFNLDYDGLRYDIRVSQDSNVVVQCGEPVEIAPTATPTVTTAPAEEAPIVSPQDDDIRPVVALFPVVGRPGSFVQVIANDMPENTVIEFGLGEEDSDYPTVATVQTTEYGAASAVMIIPRSAQPGTQWVVAVRTETDGEIEQYLSDAFTVLETRP